jgi:hypothetical protein
MIQVGDLVRYQCPVRLRHEEGVWLVTGLGSWKALCVQGSKRAWFWLESLEKL